MCDAVSGAVCVVVCEWWYVILSVSGAVNVMLCGWCQVRVVTCVSILCVSGAMSVCEWWCECACEWQCECEWCCV